jgi:hypothetical protein
MQSVSIWQRGGSQKRAVATVVGECVRNAVGVGMMSARLRGDGGRRVPTNNCSQKRREVTSSNATADKCG